MSALENILTKIRQNVSDSSKRVYIGYIKGVYKLSNQKTPIEDLKWIDEQYEDLIKKINGLEKSKHTKRNYYNALIIFLNKKKGDVFEKLTEERDKINKFYENETKKHKLNPKQCSNWLSSEQLDSVLNSYKKNIAVLLKKRSLDDKEIKLFQEYLILKLIVNFSGRNSFATLKKITPTKFNRLTEKAKEKSNWLILGKKDLRIRLYNFKVKSTDKFYEIEGLDDDLKNLIRIFIKHVKDRTFIFHFNGSPMTNLNLTSYLNTIFKRFYPDKKISTTMLRHITTTHKHGEDFKDRCIDAKNFNHSLEMHDSYILFDE